MVRNTMEIKLDKFGHLSPRREDENDEDYKNINMVLEQLD